MPEADRRRPPHLPSHTAWIVLIVGVAFVLRVWNLRHGLPDFVEEAIPYRKALAMWRPDGSIDWNPHFFHYPSLSIYLHLAAQKLHYMAGRLLGEFAAAADYLVIARADPSAMAITARLIGIVAGTASVAYVGLIAERLRSGAGWLAALLAAVAPSPIGVSQAIFSDTIMVVLMLAALERMLAYQAHGGRSRLITSVVLIGLATGAKYPAAVALLPLGLVLIERHRARGVALWAGAAAAALAVFLATTPYAVADSATFLRDFAFVGRLGTEGHFGNLDRSATAFYLGHLLRDLGWAGVAALGLSLVVTAVHARARLAAVSVWVLLLAFAVPILIASVMAERYIVPVTLLAIAVGAAATREILGRLPARLHTAGWALAVAVLALPVLVTARTWMSDGSTHVAARRWCEANLSQRDLVVRELYTASLQSRLEAATFMASPEYRLASPPVQVRATARPWFSTVAIPLAVVGELKGRIVQEDGTIIDLPVFDHASDINQVFYQPSLHQGVDVLITSSAVRGRFEADPTRYAQQLRFYAILDSTADVAARIRPGRPQSGPAITVYRPGERAQTALAEHGPLDPLWWAASIPSAYRDRVESALPLEQRTGGALRDADGHPSAWIGTLDEVFEFRIASFVRAAAMEHFEQGRFEHAQRLAATVLTSRPQDVGICLLFVSSARQRGDWPAVHQALERSLRALAPDDPSAAWLRLERADAYLHDGATAEARDELERVVASGDPNLVGEARRRLVRMP